jgi:hypothetical protein
MKVSLVPEGEITGPKEYSKLWSVSRVYGGIRKRISFSGGTSLVTSVPASRDAPCRETNHRYIDLKRL